MGGVFFGFFLATGGYALYRCITELPPASASQSWPSVSGIVTQSQLVRERRGRHKHRLRYTYTVNNRVYESSAIGFMDNMFGGNARETHSLFPQGKQVRVYYDPEHPDVGIVRPGARTAAVAGSLALAAIFVPFGLWGVRASFKPLKRSQALKSESTD